MSQALDTGQRTTMRSRPRYEGANIRTWIGFKHFMYLVEEAVLQWLRERGAGAQRLFHECGLGVEIVDSSVQLPALLELDDEVVAEVAERSPGHLLVTLHIDRPGGRVLALRGNVTVALVRESAAAAAADPPAWLAPLVCDEPRARLRDPGERPRLDAATFSWCWRARYFHCHFSDRVQHSAYVRALEEVVDRFLADRGMSIATLLAERGWIPVVSRARVQVLAAAHMEEVIETTFVVDEILRASAFDATMDCHVQRAGQRVHVATARILHGYAMSRGDDAGSLVTLDPATQATLLGESPR
jgi:acyl-CoA thioesterase FadM